MNLQAFTHKALFPWSGHSKLGIGFLCLGLCIGVAVRAVMLWFVDYRFDAGDASYYLDVAHNLLQYQIYSGEVNTNPVPEMYRPPLYSFFVAFIAWIFGNNPLLVQLVQLIISLMTALLTTRMTAFSLPKAAPWVFGLMMLSPFEAVYTGAVLSETITAFLLVAAACAILTLDGSKRWVTGGILLGLCVLTRDIYLPLILSIACFWIFFGRGSKRLRCFDAAVLVLSASLVIMPWTLRNYHISERLVPVSDGRLGLSLWAGTWAVNGEFTKKAIAGKQVYPPEAFRSETEKEIIIAAFAHDVKVADTIFLSIAMQRIYDDPVAVLRTYFVRAPLLWLGTRFDIFQLNTKWFPSGSKSWVAIKIILWVVNTFLILLAILGIIIAWHKRSRALILVLPILYTALIYFPLSSFENRYSQPVYPFLLVFAGIAAATLKDTINLKRFRKTNEN
jgi:4-amino-4-deoxy-L-arabinose transferase-like glycosyltransferase